MEVYEIKHLLFFSFAQFQVVFEFMSGIEESLANKLKYLGVVVEGDTLPDFNHYDEDDDDDSIVEDEEQSDDECLYSRNIHEEKLM